MKILSFFLQLINEIWKTLFYILERLKNPTFPNEHLGLRDFFIIIEKSVAMQAPYSYTMKFFEELGVDLELSDMSFSVSLDNGKGYEWASRNGLAGLFAQRTNVLNPFFSQMLSEIRKFKQHVVEHNMLSMLTRSFYIFN